MSYSEWECFDCKTDTQLEYFMLIDDLWDKYGCEDGLLCVGCFERRMGQKLQPNDFTDYPINSLAGWKKSPRLISRLKGE